MEDLYRALPKLLRSAPESDEVTEAATFVAWRRVAGEALRNCAVPFRLYRRTLIVSVLDESWRKQLDSLRWNMVGRINAMLEQTIVTGIEFRIDPKSVREAQQEPQPSPHEHAGREQTARLSARDLQAAASAIEDDELRERFLLAAGSCLGRTTR